MVRWLAGKYSNYWIIGCFSGTIIQNRWIFGKPCLITEGQTHCANKSYDMYTLCVRYEIIQVENDTSCTGGLLFLFKYMSFF